jgi:hypothetical protein
MAEEIKKEEPKIQLSADEFIRAMETGKAVDGNGKEHSFIFLSFKLLIKNIQVNEEVRIFNQVFQYNIEIQDSVFSELVLNACTFKDQIFIRLCNISGNVNFFSCQFDASFHLNHVAIAKKLFVIDTNFNDDLFIDATNIESDLKIIKSRCDRKFLVNRCQSENLLLAEGNNFNELNVSWGNYKSICLPNVREKQSLLLSSTKFSTIICNLYFINLGYMQWNSLKPSSEAKIIIEDSIMGKWDIVDCDFENVNMVIYSSKIIDAFYVNTIFPLELGLPDITNHIDNKHDILRDGYNQLKTLAQKQNDRKMFLHYQAAELRSYYATLHWYTNFRTWFQLTAMKWSNNFGASWARGVAFVGIANLFFIIVSFSCRDFDITQAGSFIAYYFEFLFSVVRKPDFISGSWETTWYFISRIFIAFGIYQTVTAFRKFGKSE